MEGGGGGGGGGGWRLCVVQRHLTVHSLSESGTVLRVPISEPVF